MRLCDPFRAAGWWFLVAERNFHLTCTCGTTQTADALRTRTSGKATVYDCPQCGTTLVGIAADGRMPQPPSGDDGHRMCGFVFGSAVDMVLAAPGSAEGELPIPACPRFFKEYAGA